MKKTLNIPVTHEALTLITGMTYARVPSWYGFTREDLKMDLVMPKNAVGHAPMPAVLWLCGGAFGHTLPPRQRRGILHRPEPHRGDGRIRRRHHGEPRGRHRGDGGI